MKSVARCESNWRYRNSPKGRLKQKEYEKRYRESKKGSIRDKRYDTSVKGRQKHDRYRKKVSSNVCMYIGSIESGSTTIADLENFMGRSLYSDEKDWWAIVKWTGADKFLRIQ